MKYTKCATKHIKTSWNAMRLKPKESGFDIWMLTYSIFQTIYATFEL